MQVAHHDVVDAGGQLLRDDAPAVVRYCRVDGTSVMGEAGSCKRAARYVYDQGASFGQRHTEVVRVERRVDAPVGGGRQGDGRGLRRGVAMVVRPWRKGGLKRVVARRRTVEAAHCHQVGAAAQGFLDQEVAALAAVVVAEQFVVVAVGLPVQKAARVGVAAGLHPQRAERRQLDAEGVHIQWHLQTAQG